MQANNPKALAKDSLGPAFGGVLRRLRQERGLSQEGLGFESGYHRTYIGLLERGLKSPSLQTIFNLANALKITPSALIRQVESKNQEILQNVKKDGK